MPESAYLYPDDALGLIPRVFAIEPAGVTIGRHPDNELPLSVDSVSRRHARLERVNEQWMISDLQSSNGTFVNGERISEARALNDGDIITFGKANFTFSKADPASADIQPVTEGSSGLRLVGDDEDSSVILSTQISDGTPYKIATVPRTTEEDLARLNQRLLALYRLSDILRGASQRENIMAALMELVFENLPADRGVALSVAEGTEELSPELYRFREGVEYREVILSKTIIRRVLTERVAVLSRDVRLDNRFQSSESIMASDIRSAMCVPLAGKRSLMGLLFLDSRESHHAFTEDDLAFVSALATDAAMTLENLSLMEENIRQERLAAVGQTISGLAHNIKNILQLARGGTELMDIAIGKKSLDDIKILWPITRRSIDRMQSLTQEMLDFSRQSKPILAEADVNELLNQIAEMVKADERVTSIKIEIQCDDSCGKVHIDTDGLSKALMNLLSNAFDALQSQPDAEIILATESRKGNVLVRVKDNGPGIPTEILPRIFQPFFSTKGNKGNGLGLSMTRKYLEDMGARLDVKSTPGEGAEFVILLPIGGGAFGAGTSQP